MMQLKELSGVYSDETYGFIAFFDGKPICESPDYNAAVDAYNSVRDKWIAGRVAYWRGIK